MNIPPEYLVRLMESHARLTARRSSEEGKRTQPAEPAEPAQPTSPPPEIKSFSGWVEWIAILPPLGVTVVLTTPFPTVYNSNRQSIWLALSDGGGNKLTDAALAPFLEEFKRAQSHRLSVNVTYQDVGYRNLVKTMFVYAAPIYTTPSSEIPNY